MERAGFVAPLASGLAGLPATLASATEPRQSFPAMQCQDSMVRVALHEGGPTGHEVFVRLCTPSGATPKRVQLLVHGVTYAHDYWSVPDPADPRSARYDYVAHALASGDTTLSIDRIGGGRSSHPPSAAVDLETNAFVLHQLVGALRRGGIAASDGRRLAFETVVLVGHSYGSGTSLLEASLYDDVDALVITGFTHDRNTTPRGRKTPHIVPANTDPKFASRGWDDGYLTTAPGVRYELYFSPGEVDPTLIARDEEIKETFTAAEMTSLLAFFDRPLDIRVPTLLVMGEKDPLFSGPDGEGCRDVATLLGRERPHLGSRLPSLDGYILPASGHNLNMMPNAPAAFAAMLDWLGGLPPGER